MKAIKIFAVLATASVLAVSCSLFSKSTASSTESTDTTAATTTSATATEGQTAGQNAGSALKTLYSSYVANNKKLDLSNSTNLLTAAALATAIQDLKGCDSSYKKSFAKGLVLGSTGLVSQTTSTDVTGALTDLATEVSSSSDSSASSTAATAASVLSNASTISTALSGIFGSLGK